MEYNQNIIDKICDTLVKAGSSFLGDKKKAYSLAIDKETNAHAKWVLQTVLQNAEAHALRPQEPGLGAGDG